MHRAAAGLPDSPAVGLAGTTEAPGAPTNAQRTGEAVSPLRAGTYVYGVVPGDAALDALDDERLPEVWAMEVGDLAALVSDTRAEDDTAMSEAGLAHWQVLAVAAGDPPVVPLRPGVVFASDNAVRDQLLRPRRAELTQLLEQFPPTRSEDAPAYDHDHAQLREILGSQPDLKRLPETHPEPLGTTRPPRPRFARRAHERAA